MLSSIFLLVCPLLLGASVSAAPKLIKLSPEDDVEIQCAAAVTVTATKTIWATQAPGPAGSGFQEKTGSPAAPPTAASEQHYPAASLGAFSMASQASHPSQAPAPVANAPSNQPDAAGKAQPSLSPQSAAPAEAAFNATADAAPPSSYRNALYFTNWGIYGANYQPQQLPASQITHVLYAFADIASDGEVKTSDSYADLQKHYPTDSWNDQGNNAYGCVKQLYILKKKNRNMKVLLSIGGWTYSPKFPPVAATESGRQRFCSSTVKLIQDWGLDGMDIDWEYPANAAEAQNFVLLLQTCRQALDGYAAQHAPGYHFLITIAAPAGAQHYNIMDLPGMDPWIDAWHLMAYDYAGSWDLTSGHQSNIFANGNNPQSTKFSTEQAVRDYLVRGIPANKIVMGLPLYGRSFEATPGLGQPYNGIGAGSIQSGVWLYRDLPRAGAQEMFDDVAKASYSYDQGNKELITYDTVTSAVTKAQYLVKRGLGGAVFWEASGDKSGASSLVATLAQQMAALDPSPNLLVYPASQYDNIRAGMPGA
ncbi:glycoside hydrolase family 18 protein [Lasiosphaeria miniovina]|uniref:chitinase n=1 Tax=Lasiosphaeria miniovina TaxID=1954250 RepID=A0AA40BHA5_9PEZI|nr:glycoside hydrolase family 18 protein [Lasiosphaeria miniovina]KAK0733988.1 glycoside hydrolase family 18 protein [Lasiosphaeria miniovina]